MAPDQRGEAGDVIVADIHAVRPDLADGLLHVDGVPVHDGIESEAKGAELLFLSLLERTPDFAAFAVVNAAAEAMAQFRVVELGQDAASERRVVDVVKDVDGLGDPADFGQRARRTTVLVACGEKTIGQIVLMSGRGTDGHRGRGQSPGQCREVFIGHAITQQLP
jgi:hypothetical protein